MARYSNLTAYNDSDHYNTENKDGIWRNLKITESMYQHRKPLESRLDRFATFMWRGANAWKSFGAFIIADKQGDLKLFNGPSFTNNYSAPQFSPQTGNLLGVTFKQQTFSFKIGVYWITKEHYRQFLNWLNPKEINYLSFGDSSQYGYLVKLSKIEDSPKYIIGKEGTDDVYYTELTLNWEIQGPSCARWFVPYKWDTTINNSVATSIINTDTNPQPTDLDTPLIINMEINCGVNEDSDIISTLQLQGEIQRHTNKEPEVISLFDLTLKNITLDLLNPPVSDSDEVTNHLILEYDSELGLIFLVQGDNKRILNLVSVTSEGKNLVASIDSHKFYLPGRLNFDYNLSEISINIKLVDNSSCSLDNVTITCYPRTNIA